MIPTTPHAGARALRRPIRPGSAPSPPSDPSSPHIPAVHPPTAGIRASRLPKRFAGRHFARQAAEWRGPVVIYQEEEEKKPARDSPARTHAWIKPRAEPEGFRRGLRRVGRSDLRRGRAPAGSIVAAARGLVRGERCWSSNWAAVLRDSGAVAAAAGTPAGFASRRSVRRGFVEGLAPLHREVVEAAAGGRSVRIGRQEDSGRVHGRLDRGFQLAPPGAMAADSGMGFHQGIAAAASVYNHHHHHHHNMLSFQSSSSDASMGGGGAGMALMSMGGPSSTAGPFLSPNNSSSNNNNGVFGNSPVVGPSRSSSGGASRGGTTASKYKFITGSPSEWSDRELNLLNEGLTRYAREPNIMRYIKIAAMLPNRTIRDVALRCWWAAGKDRRKKPEGFFTGKKMRDMKPMQDKMFASAPMANFHMAPTNSSTPFSISIQNPNQQCQVPTEAISDVMDSATQQLLEENNQLLNQIAANIESFKTGNNAGLFLRTNSNIKTILSRMSETPGIMGRMPPLPEFAHEDKLNSLLQVDRMVQSYSAAHTSHMKEEP